MMECRNPEMYRGAEPEVRQEMLWRYARGEPAAAWMRAHMADCPACASAAKSLEGVARGLARRDAVTLAVCPSAEALSRYHYGAAPAGDRGRIERHLTDCALCRGDLAWLRATELSNTVAMPRRRLWLYAAAAAVVLAAIVPAIRNRSGSPLAALAEAPVIDRADLAGTLAAALRPALDAAAAAYESGDAPALESSAREILRQAPRDPGGLLLLALHAYRKGDMANANRLAKESEAVAPMTDYRCWVALQMALLAGDTASIERECRHVDPDPRYTEKARRILRTVRARSGRA